MSGRTWEDNKLAINELWPAYVFTGEERKLWTDDLSHLDQAMLYDAIRNAKRSHETPFPQIKWLTDAYRELNRLRKGATHFKDPQHPRLKVDVKDDENRRLVGGLRFVEEPNMLRFFFGRLAPTSDWQDKLVDKFRVDLGDSL